MLQTVEVQKRFFLRELFIDETLFQPGYICKNHYGYNVMTNDFGSMLASGIVDPAKVTRSAVQNAASVAMMILTTEALVTDLKEEKPETPAMPGGMGDY